MVVVELLLASAIALVTYILWSRRKFYKLAWKMPGPLGLPLLGIIYEIKDMAKVLPVFLDYTIKYKSKTILMWLGPWPAVYTIDPKLVQVFLNSPNCLDKSMIYEPSNDMLGEGLVTSKAERWSKHRKFFNPSFKHSVLLNFFPTFNGITNKLCDQIEKNLDCGGVNLKALLFDTTMEFALVTSLGMDIDEAERKRITKCCDEMLGVSVIRALMPWLRNNSTFRRTKTYKSYVKSRTIVSRFWNDLIVRKIREVSLNERTKNQSISSDKSKAETGNQRNAFIDQAIDIYRRNEFTFEDIFTETGVFVFAAYETTATTLFSTLMCLAMHPEYQERLFEEIYTAFPDSEFDVKHEDFKNLRYLDMCINETFRVVSTIPIIGRTCTSDLKLSDDFVIPKGTEIVIDIFNMHRDTDIWGPEAHVFNPENFLPSNLADKHKYSFIPFSKGPRNCIGWQYAGMFMKVMLAKILRKYKFSTKFKYDDLGFETHMTLKYVELPRLDIERR